ncbi:hypothetical protein ES332_A12G069400v1 [Gossypium tomentosum]|uniref:Uncharacterized protein n=1 Tax=Gossypium tomentosum TaxID=34277 RepID=A0A5D2MUP9_GOSTO|nr:hypothetical protein ES332_A12G069400v1 [Gossypium tomentosum]
MLPITKDINVLIGLNMSTFLTNVRFDENVFPFAQVSMSVAPVTGNMSSQHTRDITILPMFKVPTVEISAQPIADSSSASDTSTLGPSSDGVFGSTSVSTVGTLGPVVEQQRPSSVNYHSMMTRSKMGIYKLKAYMVVMSDIKPSTIHEAMEIPS